jgi:hypothetical protein
MLKKKGRDGNVFLPAFVGFFLRLTADEANGTPLHTFPAD